MQWSAPGPFYLYFDFWFNVVMEFWSVWTNDSLVLVPVLRFFSFCWSTFSNLAVMVLVVIYYVIFCCILTFGMSWFLRVFAYLGPWAILGFVFFLIYFRCCCLLVCSFLLYLLLFKSVLKFKYIMIIFFPYPNPSTMSPLPTHSK